MKEYGLIGYPVEHSFSAQFFNTKFQREGIDASYTLFPLLSIDQLPKLLDEYPNLAGLNVTSPYKEEVCQYISSWGDWDSEELGAVNTLKIIRDRDSKVLEIIGYNTDSIGFRESLVSLLENHLVERALILGTGGAARAVSLVCTTLGISNQLVSRTSGDLTYETLTKNPYLLKGIQLIVNATPLGLYGTGLPHIPYDHLNETHLCYDLIYNPEETKFLSLCKEKGCLIKNGLEMLYRQAEASWVTWQAE